LTVEQVGAGYIEFMKRRCFVEGKAIVGRLIFFVKLFIARKNSIGFRRA